MRIRAMLQQKHFDARMAHQNAYKLGSTVAAKSNDTDAVPF
jgi:hypothetical protein